MSPGNGPAFPHTVPRVEVPPGTSFRLRERLVKVGGKIVSVTGIETEPTVDVIVATVLYLTGVVLRLTIAKD